LKAYSLIKNKKVLLHQAKYFWKQAQRGTIIFNKLKETYD